MMDKYLVHLTEGSARWWFRMGLDDPMLLAIMVTAVFAFGSCLGSFLNVCIRRLPEGQSVAREPSHCLKCGAPIHWYDNIPVVSYLVLRGRCRSCREHYSAGYLVVELLTGLLFVAVFLKIGFTRQPAPALLTGWALVLLAVTTAWIDARYRLILDVTTYPAMAFGLIANTAFPEIRGAADHLAAGLGTLFDAAVYTGFLSLFAVIGRLIAGRDALGWGDVKFAAAVACLLGGPATLFTLAAGALGGTVYGVGSALVRRRPLRRIAIPFGPFLAGAAVLWIFIGEFLLRLLAGAGN